MSSLLILLVSMLQTMIILNQRTLLPFELTKRMIYSHTTSIDGIDRPLQICQSKQKTTNYTHRRYTMHSLDDYLRYQAPFFSFFHALDSAKQGSILEVGCGGGRALLDLKSEYPSIKVYGTNPTSHDNFNRTAEAFWDVANHFDIPVYCDHQGRPSFPVILETHPIQSAKFTTLFQPGTFDFIFSRHALYQGKLAANESYIFIPRLLPLLKVGSPAMIHMLSGTFHSTSDNKYYPILQVWNIVSKDAEQTRVSVVLYQTLCYASAFCISVLFKKCAPGAALHGTYHDCIVPPSISHRLPPPGWLLPELARVARLAKARQFSSNRTGSPPADGGGPFRYAHAYMARFVAALDRWEHDGAIRDSEL